MNRKKLKYSQNFITSKKNIHKLISLTDIAPCDHVIEIGAGKGHFTKKLADRSHFVTAIEIDHVLCKQTQEAVKNNNNVKIICTDILKFAYPKDKDYKVFGNIPYHISTDIVKQLAFNSQAEYSYLIVEEGFAKRLQNLQRALGLMLMVTLDIHILEKVPRSYFKPRPSVDSVLILLKRHSPLVSEKDFKRYESFVYQWVNKDYRKLFSKKQYRQALKHAKVHNPAILSKQQFISIFNSYQLFN